MNDSEHSNNDPAVAKPGLEWIRSALVVALGVAACGLSVTLLMGAPDRAAFAASNRAPLDLRWVALGTGLGCALLAVAAIFFIGGRNTRITRFRLWAAGLGPLVLLPFAPVLFIRGAWDHRELAYLGYLLAFSLALERLLRNSAERFVARRRPVRAGRRWLTLLRSKYLAWVPLIVTLSLIALYVARVGTLTNAGHLKMATMSSDLAEFDNLFFNALNGHPLRAPAIEGDLEDWSALKVHAEFGLWLLLPFYAISPGPEALLWIQTAVVAATALPVFLLGAAALGRWAGVLFAFAYLMMPAVQRPNFYDFHFTPLGMFFAMWLLYFTFRVSKQPNRRSLRVAMYGTFALALLSREDVSIGLFVLGVFLMLRGTLVRTGLLFALLSGSYFAVVKFAIMPLFGQMWFHNIYQDLKAEGTGGFRAVIVTLLSNPAHAVRALFVEPKVLYVLHMTVPLLGLWWRRPVFWLAPLAGFVSTLLVTNRPPMFQSSFQYTYLWVPYVVAASVVVLRQQRIRVATLCSLLVVATSLGHQLGVVLGGERILGGFSEKTFEISEAEAKKLAQLQELIALIPPHASVAATESEGPHVSTRLVMYSLKFTLGTEPDYLLVGRPGIGGEVAHVRQALESGRYGVIETRGPFVLAKRGADPGRNGVLWNRVGGKPRKSR